jgi:hypothetical protein
MNDTSLRVNRGVPKYVQVKKQLFVLDDQRYKVVKIIDISAKILFNQAKGEKKLITLVNATCSHEMRTPINSISAQNLSINNLGECIMELLQDD